MRDDRVLCPLCDGRGAILYERQAPGEALLSRLCPLCHGTQKVEWEIVERLAALARGK